jgi:hypothetical protein
VYFAEETICSSSLGNLFPFLAWRSCPRLRRKVHCSVPIPNCFGTGVSRRSALSCHRRHARSTNLERFRKFTSSSVWKLFFDSRAPFALARENLLSRLSITAPGHSISTIHNPRIHATARTALSKHNLTCLTCARSPDHQLALAPKVRSQRFVVSLPSPPCSEFARVRT